MTMFKSRIPVLAPSSKSHLSNKNKPLREKQAIIKSSTYKTSHQHECPRVKTINKAPKCAERTKIVPNHVRAKENVRPPNHPMSSIQKGTVSRNRQQSSVTANLRRDVNKNLKAVNSVNLNSKLNPKQAVAFAKGTRKLENVKKKNNAESLNPFVDVKKSQIDNPRGKKSVITDKTCEKITENEENGPGIGECESGKRLAGESQPAYISLQKDIHFEANEYCRKLILSGRELTPSVMPSGAKLSFWENKPSFYQKLSMSSNPVEETLKAVEKLRLTNPKQSLTNRGSLLWTKRESSTPCLRNSRFVECDPFKQALKKLDTLRTKSSKKVTFNLRTAVIPNKTGSFSCEESNAEELPESSESRLTNICEKDEAGGSNSGKNFGNRLPPSSPNDPSHSGGEPGENAVPGKETACESSHFPSSCKLERNKQSVFQSVKGSADGEQAREFDLLSMQKRHLALENFPQEKTNYSDNVSNSETNDLSSVNRTCSSTTIKHFEKLACKSSNAETLFTPCPFSLYAQSKQAHSGSPEFLEVRSRKGLSDYPPIYTPLALRCMAKEVESAEKSLTNVQLKLDFDAEEMELLKSKTVCDNQSSIISLKRSVQLTPAFQRIATAQKFLDHLADQECSILLLSQTSPILCGRYIKNPIALVLEEGDEMHFLPIGAPDF